jgi:DNA-binding transcriptional ArsR family regulator
LPQTELQVIDAADTASAVLHPLRLEILSQLRAPGSSTTLGHALGLSRQKVNYHVKELERRGLLEEVGTRQRKGCTERLFQSRALSYVVDPGALGPVQTAPSSSIRDRFSSAYLIATAARTIRDVARLRRGADRAGKKLATLTLETEVHFDTPVAQQAFLDELSETVAGLAAKYQRPSDEGGRTYRLTVASHPTVPNQES